MTCTDTLRMDGLYYMYIYIDYTIVCITYMMRRKRLVAASLFIVLWSCRQYFQLKV